MLTLTNEVLFEKATPVTDLSDVTSVLVDMISVMAENNGVGLAAPQVGINKRFFIMRKDADISMGEILVCVNPTIKSLDDKTTPSHEGCLSHPGKYKYVPRHEAISVAYYDDTGKFVFNKFEGLNAFIYQHEMDHLNGKTIISKILD